MTITDTTEHLGALSLDHPTMRCFSVGRGARIVVLPTADAATEQSVESNARDTAGPVVALQLWVAGGTAAETAEEHGCAHLLEHMLFKAAAGRPDLAALVESVGGDVNAFTSHDETVVYATVPTGAEGFALPAMLESVVRPQIHREALATEIQVVAEEILQYRDDPSSVGMANLYARLFPRHPYARPVLGTRAEIRRHDVRRLRRFHRRVYAARRISLVVVGPVDPDAIVASAAPWLERLPAGPVVDEGAVITQPLRRPQVRVVNADVGDAHVHLGWRAPPLPDPDAVALEVASIVLGYGEASRLTRTVRRGAQLVTDVHASFYPARSGSGLTISAHAAKPQLDAAVAGILGEVDALTRVPMHADELERARVVLASDLVYRRETAQGHAHALGQNLSTAGSLDFDRHYHQTLDALTAADIRRACARWLAPTAVACSAVVPGEGRGKASGLQSALLNKIRAKVSARPALRVRRDRRGVVATQLSCGLRVLAKVDARVPLCAGWMVWAGGLRRENARQQGSSSMMATLLTRGCDAIDGDSLASEIEGQAAALDGFSGRNTAGLHFECMAGSTPQVLRRALQSAVAPRFELAELIEARRVALQELASERDDLAKVAFRAALGRLYRGHPFRFRSHGSASSLTRLSSRGLRRTWAEWYPIGDAVLAMCGDVDVDGLLGVLEQELADVPKSAKASRLDIAPPDYLQSPVELREHREREQAHLVMAMPGLAFFDRSSAALDVLLAVLGGQAGRLFVALREEQGLVYHVAAQSTEGVDAGDLTVYAAASPDRIGRARKALEAELARICDELVGDEELARAKALLIGQHAMGMERHGRVAFQLAFNETFGIPRHDHLRYRERVGKVKAVALRTLARRLLAPSRRIVALVGP